LQQVLVEVDKDFMLVLVEQVVLDFMLTLLVILNQEVIQVNL
jgi:hypothetical protein